MYIRPADVAQQIEKLNSELDPIKLPELSKEQLDGIAYLLNKIYLGYCALRSCVGLMHFATIKILSDIHFNHTDEFTAKDIRCSILSNKMTVTEQQKAQLSAAIVTQKISEEHPDQKQAILNEFAAIMLVILNVSKNASFLFINQFTYGELMHIVALEPQNKLGSGGNKLIF